MVTKHTLGERAGAKSSVLAKILMVTKLCHLTFSLLIGSVLAKIHMVTKLAKSGACYAYRSVLAKIHMVTKLAGMSQTF